MYRNGLGLSYKVTVSLCLYIYIWLLSFLYFPSCLLTSSYLTGSLYFSLVFGACENYTSFVYRIR